MNVQETTQHVLCICPAYDALRMDCILSLAVLSPPQHLSKQLVLSPSCPSPLLEQILQITGVYINALQRARLF